MQLMWCSHTKNMALFLFCQYINNLRGMCNRSIKIDVRCPQNVHSVQYSVLTHWFKSEIRNILEYKFKPENFVSFFH